MVRLNSRLELDDGRVLPAGATGAVVGVWADGAAYEVEFSKPFDALATVGAAELSPAETVR